MKIFINFAELAINPDTGVPNLYAILDEPTFEELTSGEEVAVWDCDKHTETIELALQNIPNAYLKHEEFEYYRIVTIEEPLEVMTTDQCYSEGQMAGFKDFLVSVCNKIESERTFVDAYNALEDEPEMKALVQAWKIYVGDK